VNAYCWPNKLEIAKINGGALLPNQVLSIYRDSFYTSSFKVECLIRKLGPNLLMLETGRYKLSLNGMSLCCSKLTGLDLRGAQLNEDDLRKLHVYFTNLKALCLRKIWVSADYVYLQSN